NRVLLPERTVRDPAQLLHVPSQAERLADVDSEGAHVGARVRGQVEEEARSVGLDELEPVDRTDPPLPFHRGTYGRGLVDRPGELREDPLDLLDRDGSVEDDRCDVPLRELEDER